MGMAQGMHFWKGDCPCCSRTEKKLYWHVSWKYQAFAACMVHLNSLCKYILHLKHGYIGKYTVTILVHVIKLHCNTYQNNWSHVEGNTVYCPCYSRAGKCFTDMFPENNKLLLSFLSMFSSFVQKSSQWHKMWLNVGCSLGLFRHGQLGVTCTMSCGHANRKYHWVCRGNRVRGTQNWGNSELEETQN